jgi:translocation and assembly module TamB
LLLLKSRLHGQSLTGEVKARFERNDVRLDRLLFQGKGFTIQASGELAKRTDVAIHLSDLSLFAKNAGGDIDIKGWGRRTRHFFSGSLVARGKNLVTGGAKAEALEILARIEGRKASPFTFTVSALNAAYSGVRANSIFVQGSGTTTDHTVSARLQSNGYTISAGVTGAYMSGTWQGTIDHLAGTEPGGTWSAQEQASVTVSREVFSLSPLVITGSSGQRLELGGRIGKNPLSGSFYAEWRHMDISRANAWLTGLRISGLSGGRINCTVLPGERLQVTAEVSVSGGTVGRRLQQVELKAELKRSDLSLVWRNQTVESKLSLVLADYGRLDAGLTAPLPAQFPVSFSQNGAVRGFVKGRIRETGLISLLFPGMVQESRGQIEADISADGTWNSPRITGSILLRDGGAYFPAAGIRLSDIRIEAGIDRNTIRIDSLKARSGPGSIEGKATIILERWSIAQYQGTLQGERFQALFLPQMQMLVSPKLEFSGTREKMIARGEVRVPELLVYGPPKEEPVEPSEDVVILGRQTEVEKKARMARDIQIRIILGDRVIVKAEGADAQLSGETLLSARPFEEATARGEIKVTKGKYSAYGVSLNITRGRIIFAGGPIGNPLLDILAVRTLDEVKAGVLVSGTVKKPVVKLYSQPAMPDADVLAYMVLGHPLGQDREQGTYLMQAAAALLSAGQSVALQDQIKQRLGLDIIDVQTGGGEVSRSLITIGKYLSSRLYISYGLALFNGENVFRLRYKFSKRWELESRSGETSGLDLYYTVQFD